MESDTGTDKTADCRGANGLQGCFYLTHPILKKLEKKPAGARECGCNGLRFVQIAVKPAKNKSNQYTDDILKTPFFITAYLWGQQNQQEKLKKDPPVKTSGSVTPDQPLLQKRGVFKKWIMELDLISRPARSGSGPRRHKLF